MKPHIRTSAAFLFAGTVFFCAPPSAWAFPAIFRDASAILLNSTAAVAAPVPFAVLLLGVGTLCLIGLRRRSRPQA